MKSKIFPDIKSAQAALNQYPSGRKLTLAGTPQGWIIHEIPNEISIDKSRMGETSATKTSGECSNEKRSLSHISVQQKAVSCTDKRILSIAGSGTHLQNLEKLQAERNKKQTYTKIKSNNNIKEKNVLEKHEELALSKRRKENAEASVRIANRKAEHEKNYHGTSIPEYEEGTPRTEFGTRDEYKKMRARDWGDMQKRHRE